LGHFLPCFLFIFLGAPHIEKLGEQPRLSAALTAITAAVVGVILNLGVKFTTHALWPASGGFDVFIADPRRCCLHRHAALQSRPHAGHRSLRDLGHRKMAHSWMTLLPQRWISFLRATANSLRP
jgi:hypothetical protein